MNNNIMQQTYDETTLDYIQNNKWNLSSEQNYVLNQDKNIKLHSKIREINEQTKQKFSKFGTSIYK